jgi:hypothetical protein
MSISKNRGGTIMANAVMFISYKLAKGASVQDFLLASENVQSEFMSKQKGYISWKLLADGDMWADALTWETMEDAQSAMAAGGASAANQEFFAFLDQESVKIQMFSIEKSY